MMKAIQTGRYLFTLKTPNLDLANDLANHDWDSLAAAATQST